MMMVPKRMQVLIWLYSALYFGGVGYCLYETYRTANNHNPFYGTWLDWYFGHQISAAIVGIFPLSIFAIIQFRKTMLPLFLAVFLFFFYYLFAFHVLSD